jgi:hypothetical protein
MDQTDLKDRLQNELDTLVTKSKDVYSVALAGHRRSQLCGGTLGSHSLIRNRGKFQ